MMSRQGSVVRCLVATGVAVGSMVTRAVCDATATGGLWEMVNTDEIGWFHVRNTPSGLCLGKSEASSASRIVLLECQEYLNGVANGLLTWLLDAINGEETKTRTPCRIIR